MLVYNQQIRDTVPLGAIHISRDTHMGGGGVTHFIAKLPQGGRGESAILSQNNRGEKGGSARSCNKMYA